MEENKTTIAEQTAEAQTATPEGQAQEQTEAVDYAAENTKLKAEIEKLKQATTKASADASNYKKQLQERMTAQEKADAERAEREAAKDARLAELEARERVSNYRAQFMANGFDEQTALDLAQILPDGVSDEFFTKQRAFLDAQRKVIEAQALNKQPDLTAGMPPSKEDIETANLKRWFGLN